MNAKSSAKKTKTASRKSARTSKKSSKKNKRLRFFFLKIVLLLIFATIIYGIYLDQQIKERINGDIWELPATIYGQIVELEPDGEQSKEDIISLLNSVQYRQVLTATRPGEFVVNENSIDLYRRPFHFPDSDEPEFKVKLLFNNDRLLKMVNQETKRNFGLLRIDPKLISMLRSPNNEQRLFVPLSEFPDSMIKTLIATEDRNFYSHHGISVTSILRAIYANVTSGRTVQGGSTLTQQVIKNLFLTNERSYIRKLREAYMALILDMRYSKEKILELYLNEVYLGQNSDEEIHGFPLASLYYFGRPVNELSIDQQALLVGIVKGASYYNPWTKPKNAIDRRDVVLKLIKDRGIINEELYQLFIQRPLAVLPKGGVISPQPAFVQLVKNSLKNELGEQAAHLSGMKIFTTLDPSLQIAAENSVIDQMEYLRKRTKKADLQAAMVIVDRLNGEVKALIGSAEPAYAGFNRALNGRRPIGSLAKPPTYLSALSQPENYQLNTWLDDKPLHIKLDQNSVWEPKNFDKQYRNQVILVDGLAQSLNIPSINLGMKVGFNKTEKTLTALGVPSTEIKSVPSRFLGTLELTPFETAQMFQAISNGGKKATLSTLRYVVSDKGDLIYQRYPNIQQVVPKQAAYLTTFAMQKVAEYGTARALASRYGDAHIAAKTGTTNDSKDSWFVGIDGKTVSVIWVGLDDHKPMKLTGSSGALTIYQNYLSRYAPSTLTQEIPKDIKFLGIDQNGDWMCDGQGVRVLPVWITNTMTMCQTQNLKNSSNWLKRLFRL